MLLLMMVLLLLLLLLVVVVVVELDSGCRNDLEGGNPEKELAKSSLLDGSIVELGKLVSAKGLNSAGESKNILSDSTSSRKHSQTSILQLCLAQPAENRA